jgi:cytochrome oxidase assembly protein ShyY1
LARLPLFPTLVVAAAVAVMIGLGFWQLDRRAQKNAALDRYAAAQGLMPIAWPTRFDPAHPPLFRRSKVDCSRVLGWRQASGRNVKGDAGWLHIATCETPQGAANIAAGWSARPSQPAWGGGIVVGVIGPDSERTIRLIADRPPAGLQRARAPSLDDVPNNHLAYAVQWFFFALVAAVIYFLALKRRSR